jgi:hypothetical protein
MGTTIIFGHIDYSQNNGKKDTSKNGQVQFDLPIEFSSHYSHFLQ